VHDATTGDQLAAVTVDKEIQKVWLADTKIVIVTYERPPNVFELRGI
jgi:hypothetical protein